VRLVPVATSTWKIGQVVEVAAELLEKAQTSYLSTSSAMVLSFKLSAAVSSEYKKWAIVGDKLCTFTKQPQVRQGIELV
jgi:hypothetical protein